MTEMEAKEEGGTQMKGISGTIERTTETPGPQGKL